MNKVVSILIVITSIAFSQTVQFSSTWKFIKGNNSQYKDVDFDDSQWKTISVPGQWETQGYPDYDGYAWYRLHFTMPKNFNAKDLFLLAGKVDDVDETFLNGVSVGQTGGFPPTAESAWNVQRIYPIPQGLLKQNNVIAIRVYDGGGPGGITGGSFGIYTKKQYISELNLGPAPKKSYSKLTTSNGLIAAVYDEKTNSVETVFPYIFQAVDSGKTVSAFARNIIPSGTGKPLSVAYDSNTHVIKTTFKNFSIYYFAPFTTHEKIFYAVVRGYAYAIQNIRIDSAQLGEHAVQGTIYRKGKNGIDENYFLYSFNDSLYNGEKAIPKAALHIIASPTSLIDSEVAFMNNVQAACTYPKVLTEKERSVVEQSITLLKMAQVGDDEKLQGAKGQIVASLPPGVWNIAWVRDGSYAVSALSKLGMFSEAKKALQFILSARSNHYKLFIYKDGKDYGIGVDYQVSVCRYFGNGKEESDFNDQGPNIEIDGFGLTLSAFADYVQESRDTSFFMEWNDLIASKIADPILHCIAENDLIRADSGPWERHLPGKQFAYTSAACAAGLERFAELRNEFGFPAEQYSDGAQHLKNGIMSHLLSNNTFFKGNAEAVPGHDPDIVDGASIELFAKGVVTDKNLFTSHMNTLNKEIKINDPLRGYMRVNSPDWYDSQEWLFLDARAASANAFFGNNHEAKRLIDWITSQSVLNFNLIPELFGKENATYEGAVPMVGFGAGAYILSLFDYSSQR